MDKWGLDPCLETPRIPEAEEFLLECYKREWPELILKASADDTKRRNIQFALNWPYIFKWGGTVNYCKKTRRFDFIEYSSYRNRAKRISLIDSDTL